VFYVDVSTNSDYFVLNTDWLVALNETQCVVLCGTNWIINQAYKLGFPMSVLFYQCWKLTFNKIPEGQTTNPGNLPKSSAVSEIGEHLIEKHFQFFLTSKVRCKLDPVWGCINPGNYAVYSPTLPKKFASFHVHRAESARWQIYWLLQNFTPYSNKIQVVLCLPWSCFGGVGGGCVYMCVCVCVWRS
jgi:hypothetical protein